MKRALLAAAAVAAIAAALFFGGAGGRGATRPASAPPSLSDASPAPAVTPDDPTMDSAERARIAEAARTAEAAESVRRAQYGRLTSSVRGALAGVVGACAPRLGNIPAAVFIRLDARWQRGRVALADIAVDVRSGARTAPPAFAQCVIERGASLQLPWISDEEQGSSPVSLTFSLP